MSTFSLHVYCLFSGISMSLPFGNAENQRLALDMAMSMVGPGGQAISSSGQVFYLKTADQLDALFALQRRLNVKRPTE